MSRTHGELFGEIGAMVFAAHQGQEIDLAAASEDLASRYAELRLPADSIARAIARSAGAVGISLALVAAATSQPNDEPTDDEQSTADDLAAKAVKTKPRRNRKPAYAGLASGGRIAMLS
jgi:hypothetical protein